MFKRMTLCIPLVAISVLSTNVSAEIERFPVSCKSYYCDSSSGSSFGGWENAGGGNSPGSHGADRGTGGGGRASGGTSMSHTEMVNRACKKAAKDFFSGCKSGIHMAAGMLGTCAALAPWPSLKLICGGGGVYTYGRGVRNCELIKNDMDFKCDQDYN